MAVDGVIAKRVQGVLPVTWDALTRDSRFGDDSMQQVIDTVKENVFGTVVAPAAESAYPLMAIDYAAKLIALEIIPAGIDFWMNEAMAVSATGTNENHTFTDRAATLRDLRDDLLRETRLMRADVEALLGFRRATTRGVPRMNTIDDELLTPSPQDFPRPFAAPRSGAR